MSNDPVYRLAQLRVVKVSAELEVELAFVKNSGPALHILRMLRERAADSLNKLAFCQLQTRKGIEEAITLQNEVKRYDEWFGAIRQIIAEGKQVDQEISIEERQDMLDHLLGTPEGQQQAVDLGLVNENPTD